LTTGKYGLAEARYTPPAAARSTSVSVTAVDERGNRLQATRVLSAVAARESVLLRLDKATASVGDNVHLDAFTTAASGDIFLDVIRSKRDRVHALPVKEGGASADLVLGPDLLGTIRLHAYKVPGDGSIVRDSRLLVVSGGGDLRVEATATGTRTSPAAGAVSFWSRTRQVAGACRARSVRRGRSVYAWPRWIRALQSCTFFSKGIVA
jgi:hypothetical protein